MNVIIILVFAGVRLTIVGASGTVYGIPARDIVFVFSFDTLIPVIPISLFAVEELVNNKVFVVLLDVEKL